MLLHDYLDYHGRTAPSSEFAVQGDRVLTYGEAVRAANRIANALIGGGLEKGDRFGLLGKNSIEFALIYYAASKAGVVPVPLNYRLAPAEWKFILEDSESKLLVADAEFCEAAEPVAEELGLARATIEGAAPAGWRPFEDWVGQASDARPDRVVSESDDIIQMYTSGTTGRPKGAVLTQYSVCSNLSQAVPSLADAMRSRILLAPPLYHIAAACVLFGGIVFGRSMLVHRDFIPGATVKALQEDGVGLLMAVPAIIQACLTVPGVEAGDYSRLRCIGYGGSAISEVTLRRALEVFRSDFFQGYGLTESSPILTVLSPADHRRALESEPGLLLSAGRAVAGTELITADPLGRPVAPGEVGEILARGPQLMKGYWKRPEATAEALQDGWLHTGDAATMDDEGYVYIQDRVKDMIVSGGENIYPREVEEILFQHEAVADVAVIGVPHERWGETVHAVLVAKGADRPSLEALDDFCRRHLGGYKAPRSVEWVDALPRNPSGKILKRILRDKFWAGKQRRVGGS